MRYDTHVLVQSYTKTKDTDGSEIETPVTFAEILSRMITTGGKEFYAAQKVNSETTAVFESWYVPGIKNTMQIIMDDGRVFDILLVNNVNNQNQTMLVSCKEVV